MKRICVFLKTGKELTFDAEDGEINKDVITASDGTQYILGNDAAEAVIITPIVKCPDCGQWTVPTKKEISNDGILYKIVLNACGYCGHAFPKK